MIVKETKVPLAYCDTSSLLSNLTKTRAPKPEEAQALSRLLQFHAEEKLKLMRSNVIVRELEKTKDPNQRRNLLSDFVNLMPVAKDENVCGFAELTDPYGGHISNPLVSDVQDEKMVSDLLNTITGRKDAEHLTQAITNGCDYFLSDDGELLKHALTIEKKYGIRILKPSDLARQM
jgi:hypothetical protein